MMKMEKLKQKLKRKKEIMLKFVVKRNGITDGFKTRKLMDVISKVFTDGGSMNHKDFKDDIFDVFNDVCEKVEKCRTDYLSTDELNDYVYKSFNDCGFTGHAESFKKHRELYKVIRDTTADMNAMSEYIFMSKYSRYIPELNRRETWNECVNRVRDMHIRRYPVIKDSIIWAFEHVRKKIVLPSMRSMQFAGSPIENNHARMYNCSYSVADRLEFFPETLYLLLCGCGVGFSVEKQNVEKLPPILKIKDGDRGIVETDIFVIDDSIEGWSDCIKVLFNAYTKTGIRVKFDYSKIRPKGSPISSGGTSPGPEPLISSVNKIVKILDDAQGRKLKPIEVYDCVMHAADAVLAGGVRRSACICMFSEDDKEMSEAKTGDWFVENPQRGRSNNSVKLLRDTVTREQFQFHFDRQRQSGDPGFFFVDDIDYGSNPCVEIGLNPFIETENGKESGFQFCNLTTLNGKMLVDEEIFEDAVSAAAIIGTCQAGYTNFNYVSENTKLITERESLLGVSITGIMDNPEIILDPAIQRKMAKLAVAINKKFSESIGIPQASRVTCVKPEGTTSVLLDTASGIHPRFARKYIRRVQANTEDPIYKIFKEKNPHCCEPSMWSANGTDDVISFSIKAPEDAICTSDLTAIEFLEKIKSTQQNWVLSGNAIPESSPFLNHNVSNTVTVKEHEWDEVADYIYENREYFTGIALLSDTSDMKNMQAPHEEIDSSIEEYFEHILNNYTEVDYTSLKEERDNTTVQQTIACGGGACELK